MSRQKEKVMIRHKSAIKLPPPEVRRRGSSASSLAEMAGETTAEVAAVACCAPYGVANLVVLAAYKLPAGLCRKAIRERRRRRLIKSGLLHTRSLSYDDELFSSSSGLEGDEVEMEAITEEEFVELEKEMWDHFSGAGFFRGTSLTQA